MNAPKQLRKNIIVHSEHLDLWDALKNVEGAKNRADRFRTFGTLGAIFTSKCLTMGSGVSLRHMSVLANETAGKADDRDGQLKGSEARKQFSMNIVVHSSQCELWEQLKDIDQPRRQAERLRELASIGAMFARGRIGFIEAGAELVSAAGGGAKELPADQINQNLANNPNQQLLSTPAVMEHLKNIGTELQSKN